MKFVTTCIFLVCSLITFVACKPDAESAVKISEEIYFNQTLLREAAPYLEKKFNVRIEFSRKLEELDNLWIDYQTKGEKETIDQILKGIATAVRRDHGLGIEIDRLDVGKNVQESYRITLADSF